MAELLREQIRLPSMRRGEGDGGSDDDPRWSRVPYKTLAQLPLVRLASPRDTPVLRALRAHRSERRFAPAPLAADVVATLFAGLSINRRGSEPSDADSRRSYPSAGARYPVDAYAIVRRCEGIGPGVYFFDVRHQALRQLPADATAPSFGSLFGEEWPEESPLVVVLTAQWRRSEMKYGGRGLLFAAIEAGHMAQNLSSIAAELGVASCMVAGFWSDGIDRLLRLVRPEESALYSIFLGVPALP